MTGANGSSAVVKLTQPSNQYARSEMLSVSTSSNQTSVI